MRSQLKNSKKTRKYEPYQLGRYSIDFYAYDSKICGWNASFKVGLAMFSLLFCIFADQILISLFISLSMGYVTVIKGSLPIKTYLSFLLIPVTFLAVGSIPIAFEFEKASSGEYCFSFHWFYLYTSKVALWKVLCLILKAYGAISAMFMMTLSTPSHEILSVLRKAHVPKLLIELMYLTYRYIFILLDVQGQMRNAAQSRLGYCDFKTACTSFGCMMSNLFLVSLKKANAYYNAMEARCYEGELLFLEEEKKIESMQIAATIGYVVVLIGLAVFASIG